MSADQIADVALSLEYVKQYGANHTGLNYKQLYLLEQCVVWQRLSVHLGWQCDNVRASYDEISKAIQDEVYAGAKAFVKANKGRYECGGYIYSGNGQDIGQFWAKLNVGNAKLQKVSSNTSITNDSDIYSLAGAVYGVYSEKNCQNVIATLTTDRDGNTEAVEVKAGTVFIKEQQAPAGFKLDKKVYPLTVEAGKTATLKVSDTPKVTETLLEFFKIDLHKRLADVPFKITSKTTGESHIVMTDKNGQFSTASDWASHKQNTNAGKTSEDGVWFGSSEPDDSKGALLYDIYEIEELRCASNKGFKLIPAFDIVVSRDRTVIDLGTLTDEYEKEISIHTTATSKNGEKSILAGKEVTIVDTVKMDGLVKGTKYQLKSWQMLKEENAELVINGKRVESDYTFIADSEEMKSRLNIRSMLLNLVERTL